MKPFYNQINLMNNFKGEISQYYYGDIKINLILLMIQLSLILTDTEILF